MQGFARGVPTAGAWAAGSAAGTAAAAAAALPRGSRRQPDAAPHRRSASLPATVPYLHSLGFSEGVPLQGSPQGLLSPTDGTAAAGSVGQRGWAPRAAAAGHAPRAAAAQPLAAQWSVAAPPPGQLPAVLPTDQELCSLGFTPAPLARHIHKQWVRQSGALPEDTPPPLARGAGHLASPARPPPLPRPPAAAAAAAPARAVWPHPAGPQQDPQLGRWPAPAFASHRARPSYSAEITVCHSGGSSGGWAGCSAGAGDAEDEEAALLARALPKGRETALQPLGGGLRRHGLPPSPAKIPGPHCLADAGWTAATLLPPSMLPGASGSAALPSSRPQAAPEAVPAAGAIPSPPRELQAWNVAGVLRGVRQRAGDAGVPPLSHRGSRGGGVPGAGGAQRRGAAESAGWAPPPPNQRATGAAPVGGEGARLLPPRAPSHELPMVSFGAKALAGEAGSIEAVPSALGQQQFPSCSHSFAGPLLQYGTRAWDPTPHEVFSPLRHGLLDPASGAPVVLSMRRSRRWKAVLRKAARILGLGGRWGE